MKKTVSMVLVLVLACAMAISLVGCGGGGSAPYANVLDGFKGALEGNGKALVSVFPPEYDDIMKLGGQSMDALAEAFEAQYANTNVTNVSYKVDEEKALDSDAIAKINEDRQGYSLLGVEVKDVTEGYKLSVTYTGTADGEESSHPISMTVIKIDGNWYIDANSLKM